MAPGTIDDLPPEETSTHVDTLTLRTGFEIELLAPVGSDRQVLADAVASRCGGSVRRSFHMDSEPSTVPGVGIFRHLSPGFDVDDASGQPVASFVDDITIESDLAGAAGRSGHRGWYRILCDDARLLRLVDRHADPHAALPHVLAPVAELFGVRAETFPGASRVNDATGTTVAVVMPLPAGRERPCEIVTPPLTSGHLEALELLLAPARELGFTVPHEAAVHVHVDGAPFRRPETFANVVRLFTHWREILWSALGTNPGCRRLAPLPGALAELVEQTWTDEDGRTGWSRLQEAARAVGLTKYADVNLVQLVTPRPVRDTLEVRILPGSIDAESVVRRAALVERLLLRCLDPSPILRPDDHAASDPLVALDTLTGALR